ncbi:MAG TPA: membrane dipeptidase [Actinomycetota bacterium]|nr:membrane dipeptidase [Actinomycetota bacterium]
MYRPIVHRRYSLSNDPTKSGPWFDAHLDLAYLALGGRNMTAPASEAGGKFANASVTFPELEEAGVKWALATIFTAIGPDEPWRYESSDDLDGAHKAGVLQLEQYQRWEDEGLIRIVRSAGDLKIEGPLAAVILMEGGDPIRDPSHADWWFQQGARVFGMSWFDGSRYSGGNRTKGPITDLGRDLIAALDELGGIFDVSHFSDESAFEVLDRARGPVVATHSNSRALMRNDDERHLSDELISAVTARGGIVGLNLCSQFLTWEAAHWKELSEGRRASIAEAIDHTEHVAGLAARRTAVGLGSDMDGGFSAEWHPEGIDRVTDLKKLSEELAHRGWTPAEIEGFQYRNWLSFMEARLP